MKLSFYFTNNKSVTITKYFVFEVFENMCSIYQQTAKRSFTATATTVHPQIMLVRNQYFYLFYILTQTRNKQKAFYLLLSILASRPLVASADHRSLWAFQICTGFLLHFRGHAAQTNKKTVYKMNSKAGCSKPMRTWRVRILSQRRCQQ